MTIDAALSTHESRGLCPTATNPFDPTKPPPPAKPLIANIEKPTHSAQ